MELTLIVSPVDRHGNYEAKLGDRVVVASSRQPLLDSARVLIEWGLNREARLCAHRRDTKAAICGVLGRLAIESPQTCEAT
jgi:hypothetical protein